MPVAAPGFSRAQIILHWLIAALVVFQLLFAEAMEEMVEAAEEGERLSAGDAFLGTAHYWFGIAILVLVGIRLVLRLRTGVPGPAADTNPFLDLAGRAMHWLFYALLVVVPVLGLLAYYTGDPWGEIHQLAKPAFIILIALHAGAALFHQFALRDGTLRRMLVPRR